MNTISVETMVTRNHRLELELPADFPEGRVRVTIESVSAANETPDESRRARIAALRQWLDTRPEVVSLPASALDRGGIYR